MDEDLYDKPQDNPEPEEGGEGMEGKDAQGMTFLVNKESFPNAMPGDEIMARVVAVHDSELECEPMEKEEKEGEPEPEMAGAEMGGGDGNQEDLMM